MSDVQLKHCMKYKSAYDTQYIFEMAKLLTKFSTV